MAHATPVDRLYEESQATLAAIPKDQPSLQSSAGDLFRKALLLAAASHFEHELTTCVLEYVSELAQGSQKIVALVHAKAVDRQYHTWFDWKEANANKFFGLFGKDFKEAMKERIKNDIELQTSIQNFLEIGNNRNLMVHLDFATFPLEKTLEEIYVSYQKALKFVEGLSNFLREHP